MRNAFSQEEIAWLKENYPRNESRERTYERYCEVFGPKHTIGGVVAHCKRHGIRKPYRGFKKGNVTWNKGMSKEEFKSHFSKESLEKMTKNYVNFPHVKKRIELNAPKGYVVHDLGNGRNLIMRKDIHMCMERAGFLGQGKLTETVYETYLVKKEIERRTGKRVVKLNERNAKEYMTKIREMSTKKRKIAIIAKNGNEERRFVSMSEASRELGIAISLVCRALNGQRSHTHGWRFEKEKTK